MGLLGFIVNPFRYVLGQTMRTVFAEEVRKNPIIVHADVQSDDVGTSVNGRSGRQGPHGQPLGYRKPKEAIRGFQPQYVAPLRPPRTDVEAQRLYNHIRTLAFYLDAIPFFGRRLPFNIGVDSIVGLIPGLGDYIGLLLSLYGLVLSALFGIPIAILGMMLFNVLLDCTLGLVPIVGDALDVAFKANLRNLRLLEDHLIRNDGTCGAGTFCLVFPPSNVFLPPDGPSASATNAQRRGRQVREQEQSILPDGTLKTDWVSTDAPGSSEARTSTTNAGGVGKADFCKGTMDKHGKDDQMTATTERGFWSSSVVPNEVFTTMRFEREGISLAQACSSLIQAVHASTTTTTTTRGRRWTMKEQILLWDRHVERLIHAVETMRESYPQTWQMESLRVEEVRRCVDEHLGEHVGPESTSLRMRLAVRCDGYVYVTSAALPVTGSSPLRKVVRTDTLAIPTDSLTNDDRIGFAVKTSRRFVYDEARKRVHATLGGALPASVDERAAPLCQEACFDVIMHAHARTTSNGDRRHVVTESSIANVILVFDNGRAITPSSTNAPLLPGLLRTELVRLGIVEEDEIPLERAKELCSAGQATLFLCNTLRGSMQVEWQD